MNKLNWFQLLTLRWRLFFGLGVGLSLLLGLLGRFQALPPAIAQTATGQKALVDAEETETLEQLAASGATLLADYGAFSLWRVTPVQNSRVRNGGSLQFQPDFDQ